MLKRRIVIDVYPHTGDDEVEEILETLRGVGLDPHVEIVDEHERPAERELPSGRSPW